VTVEFSASFEKTIRKPDGTVKEHLKKQIRKIVENPETGKPMRYARKGTRELYVAPFRLSYAYEENKIIFLAIYHKDSQ